MGGVMTFVALVMLAVGTTVTLLCLAVVGALLKADDEHTPPLFAPPLTNGAGRLSHPKPQSLPQREQGRRLRLWSRALFASSTRGAITLDCMLVQTGEPFTLLLRPPDSGWFAGRVEELLREWAEENRELALELREEHGRVRTTIASGGSSVYLELARAEGLSR